MESMAGYGQNLFYAGAFMEKLYENIAGEFGFYPNLLVIADELLCFGL